MRAWGKQETTNSWRIILATVKKAGTVQAKELAKAAETELEEGNVLLEQQLRAGRRNRPNALVRCTLLLLLKQNAAMRLQIQNIRVQSC